MEFLEESWIHLLAIVLAIGVIIFASETKKHFGGIIGKSFNYLYLAILALMGAHIVDILGIIKTLSEDQRELVEHLFFFVGAVFFMIYFKKMTKAIK